MLKVIAEDFINAEALDIVRPLYQELIQATRQEPLCIAYELFIDQKDPTHFIFIEEWSDHAALETHCASGHFQRLVPMINQHQRKDGCVTFMEVFPAERPVALKK